MRVSPDWVKVGRLYLPMKVRGHYDYYYYYYYD